MAIPQILGSGADGPSKATYLVHDNGGRPFKITVQGDPPGAPKAVQVFKAIDEDDEDEDGEGDGGPPSSGFQCRVITAGELQRELGAEGSLLVQMAPEAEGEEEEDAEAEELPKYEEEPCISFSAESVFVGQSPKHGARFDGNSLLLHLEGLKYVFVGEICVLLYSKIPHHKVCLARGQ